MLVENIRCKCKEQKTSVCALERELGLANGLISKWTKSSPSAATLKRIADYFGCTVDELLKED